MLALITLLLPWALMLGALVVLALSIRRPWLGVAAMMVLTPLKTMPGNHGTLTFAKGLGAASLAVVLVRALMGRRRFHFTHCEAALVLVLSCLLFALRETPSEAYDWVFVMSYCSLWLMLLIVLNGATQVREFHGLGVAFILMLVLPTVTALIQGIFDIELFPRERRLAGYRIEGTYVGANGMAVLMGIGITYVTAFLAVMGRRLAAVWRLGSLLLIVAMLWAAQMTISRSVVLSVACGGAYVAFRLPWPRRGSWNPALSRLGWVFGFCLIVTMVSIGIGSSPLWRQRWGKLDGLMSGETEGDQPRLNDMAFVATRVLERPEFTIMGVGLGSYKELTLARQTASHPLSGIPHNIVLHFFVLGGVVGLLALSLVMLAVWRHGGFEAAWAERAPPLVRAHWFAAWAGVYACLPLLAFQGGALANEIWLVVAIAMLGKRIAKASAMAK